MLRCCGGIQAERHPAQQQQQQQQQQQWWWCPDGALFRVQVPSRVQWTRLPQAHGDERYFRKDCKPSCWAETPLMTRLCV
jgi:hypothetical protein